MRALYRRLGWLCLCIAAAQGARAEELLAFKGLALGAPGTAITQDPRFDCRAVKAPAADLVCSLRPQQQETFASAPLLSLYYFFDRARLTGVVASLPETHFQTVTQALEGKYGKPEIAVEAIHTVSGKAYENRRLSWQQGATRLQAERYSGQVNRSLIRLTDLEAANRVRQRHAKAPLQDL